MRFERYDVVVVSCGAAGLSAAVAAAEGGARVAVLERAPREERGGQSRYTEAYLRMKSETEVTDDFEVHLAENSSGYVDPDLIAESARPPGERAAFLRPIRKGANFNRGEGIRMALDIGAATAGDFGSYHAEPIDPRSGVSEPFVFVFPCGILVNKDGRRFTDEAPGTVDAHYESVTRRIFEQRDGLAYVVLDAKHMRVPNYRLGNRTDKPPIAADSLPDLAAKLDIPAEALAATVAGYNAACVPGEWRPLELDRLATRALHPPKSNWALPIDEAPFHAYPIISANVFTFGGLKVDEQARVLDGDGQPIAGLYAAGEIIGTYYRTCTGATSVLKGLVFGKLAGQDAARRPNA